MKGSDRKKILILYSTGGMGHLKAAMALEDEFRRDKKVSVSSLDMLDHGNAFYRFAYLKAYVFLMTKGRGFWGGLYRFTNIPLVDRLTRALRGMVDMFSLIGLRERIEEESPNAIISTHFILPNIAGILKRKGLKTRLYTLVTDYGPHSFWLSEHIDKYFVGSESVRDKMINRGIAPERIDVTGIPVSPEFSREYDTGKLRKRYGLSGELRTVFIMTGGFGVGPMEDILWQLKNCNVDIQVIAVCGHNKETYDRIRSMEKDLNYPLIPFGFTDKVAELMRVSDLMITKAGGISVTEALDSRLPMILFASIPGQESWNEEMLVSKGCAEKARTVKDIPVLVNRMLLSDDVHDAFRSDIDKVRRPDAAKTISDIVVEESGQKEFGF